MVPLWRRKKFWHTEKSPRNGPVWYFSSKLDVPSKVLQMKRVSRILVFKIRPSQEILKIRDGNPLEAEEILSYIKSPRNRSVWHFCSELDVPSNVLHKKRVARILFFKIWPSQEILKIRDVSRILVFKIRPSQEILKIRDGNPLEAEEILSYIKSPRNRSVWHFYSELDVPSNVLQKKRVARILFFKIWPSQEILKIRDGTTWRPSQEILKIRDGNPLEAEEILSYIKSPRNRSVWHFYRELEVPSKVLQKKRVARILVFKIWPSQEILKIRDVFKIRPSQEILKIRDGNPLEAEEILSYIKSPRNRSVWHFYSELDVPSKVLQKKRVARILFFKIWPSQEILKIRDEILKIRDGNPLEAEEILSYIKSPRNRSVWHFYSELEVPSKVLQKKRVARILVFKIWPSQEILKIRDGTPLERPSQEILKIRDGNPLEAEEILSYIKSPRNRSVWHFYSELEVPSKVLQKKRVARILVFKIWPSQEILKIRDGTPLE
ncbi:hypothetical protein OROHE_008784 [Orobanche hederae]